MFQLNIPETSATVRCYIVLWSKMIQHQPFVISTINWFGHIVTKDSCPIEVKSANVNVGKQNHLQCLEAYRNCINKKRIEILYNHCNDQDNNWLLYVKSCKTRGTYTLQWLESYAHHAYSHTSYIKWSQLVLYHIKDGMTCAIIEAMSPRALMHYFLICNCWTKTWFFITMILSSQYHVCTITNAENTLQVKEQLPISITVIRLVIF